MKNKAWGGRFSKALDPRVDKINSSLQIDYVFYEYDIMGSQAHAKMLERQELITENEATMICDNLEIIKKELEQDIHDLDETKEDIHMFIEHLLIQKIGDIGKKLHTGRSRNDQVALDLRLYIRDAMLQIESLLSNLLSVLNSLSNKHKDDIMPGYTHLQQAQPISLGQYFGAYFAMFKRDISRLKDCHQRMNFSPLGTGALAGSTLPLDRHSVAKELGFDGIIENTLDAVSDRDFIIEFCGIASIIMMHMSRLSEDLIIWSTEEFSFVILDDAFATGSSLMPNKKNPDVLELIRGKSWRVFGHLMSILTVMKGLPLTYNKDMQEDKESLLDTVSTLTTCLEIITPFLESLRFNTNLMKKKAESGYLDATEIVESLIIEGMPFRDAHNLVGTWIQQATKKGYSLSDIAKKFQADKKVNS